MTPPDGKGNLMTKMVSQHQFTTGDRAADAAFDRQAVDRIAAAYPNEPTTIKHHVGDHPLLTLEALAKLADAMPASQVEYNRSDIDVATLPEDAPSNGLSIGDTIRTIAQNRSWAVLKNIESDPAYAAMLHELLSCIEPVIAPMTGPMLTMQGYIFVSSPNSVTPYHFDPEHNILLQLVGSKTMYAFPAGDARFASQEDHERYHAGSHRGLTWDDSFKDHAFVAPLAPGDAVLMPVMAPHYVVVDDQPSISLSITWRSEWSYRESEAHGANRWLRQRGFAPSMPPRWPDHAVLKSLAWRAARRFKLVG